MLENYYDRKTILEGLGISGTTLWRWMKQDDFPFCKMRGKVYFNKEEVSDYLKEHSHQSFRIERFEDIVK